MAVLQKGGFPLNFRNLKLTSGAAFVCLSALQVQAGNYQTVQDLDQGHRVLFRDGLQVGATSYAEANGGYFDMNAWRDSNFNTFTLGLPGAAHPELYGKPGDFQ